MKFTICIVNYNSGHLLTNCIKSIINSSTDFDYEIIIVDNNSSDDSLAVVRKYPNIHLIKNTKNLGFAPANNQAFINSKGEYILLLNADTELKKDSVNRLIACAESHPRAGLISAKLLNIDGSPQVGFNVRRFPNKKTAIVQLLLFDELWPNNPITRRYMCYDLDYSKIQSIQQPAASALLYRYKAYIEVGGFDEQFKNWYNDVDLCKRVKAAGWDIIFCPDAEILHHGGMGVITRTAQSTMIEAYRSQRLYYYKYFGRLGYYLISIFVGIGMILRIIALFFRPELQNFVNTRVKMGNSKVTLRKAFQAVFLDTITTSKDLMTEKSSQ